MRPTAEQLPIVHYEGHHLVVKAYAGCGKTSTLVAYAEHHRHLRIQADYLAMRLSSSISRLGGAPNMRPYSRLNWDGLS